MSETLSLAELRIKLVKVRGKISAIIPDKNKYHSEYVSAKSSYKLALAKAKIKALQDATCPAERTPTMINAVAETNEAVIVAQKTLDLAECYETGSTLTLDKLEEDCRAIKKAMGSIEVEMKTFG